MPDLSTVPADRLCNWLLCLAPLLDEASKAAAAAIAAELGRRK
jgi:hypothetical protein